MAATAWPAVALPGKLLRRCRPVAVALGVDDPPKGGCIGPRALRSCTTPDSPAQRVQTNAHRTGKAHCDGAPVQCERHRSPSSPLLAFSYKRRGFCPSCGARRMSQTAAHLVNHVIGARPGALVGALAAARARFVLAPPTR